MARDPQLELLKTNYRSMDPQENLDRMMVVTECYLANGKNVGKT